MGDSGLRERAFLQGRLTGCGGACGRPDLLETAAPKPMPKHGKMPLTPVCFWALAWHTDDFPALTHQSFPADMSHHHHPLAPAFPLLEAFD